MSIIPSEDEDEDKNLVVIKKAADDASMELCACHKFSPTPFPTPSLPAKLLLLLMQLNFNVVMRSTTT